MTHHQPWPVELWSTLLNQTLAGAGGPITRAIVLHKTDSTQDAARRLEARIADVVVAWRQTHGRGRFGRTWADSGEQGVAMTVVLPAERSERLAIAAGLAIARAIESACAETQALIYIKWPNDVVANGRKVAGVLVECADGRAYVGIGINVHQREWPVELDGRAISIAQLGVTTDRLQVTVDVLLQLQSLLTVSDGDLAGEFADRDVLTGTICGFRIGEREIRGKVVRVDPMKGLAVMTDHKGEVWLPAATTTLIKE